MVVTGQCTRGLSIVIICVYNEIYSEIYLDGDIIIV